jgi:hypothetical protein
MFFPKRLLLGAFFRGRGRPGSLAAHSLPPVLRQLPLRIGIFTYFFVFAVADEPPAVNPFRPAPNQREDAVPGRLELSNGKIFTGQIYLTRNKRLMIYDEAKQRQREIPLGAVKQIDCQVKKEWMEKEWKFKEQTLDEKMYTGRQYPAREYVHTITLHDGRTITGTLSGIIYVQPSDNPQAPTEHFVLHKRDKGEWNQQLKDLVYVKEVKLGKEALAKGNKKRN